MTVFMIMQVGINALLKPFPNLPLCQGTTDFKACNIALVDVNKRWFNGPWLSKCSNCREVLYMLLAFLDMSS